MESSDSHSGLISSPCSPLAAIRCTSSGERLPLLGRREPRRALEHIPREAERGVGRERLREPPPLGGDARGEGADGRHGVGDDGGAEESSDGQSHFVVVVFGRRRTAGERGATSRATVRVEAASAEAGEDREGGHEEEARAAAHGANFEASPRREELAPCATRESATSRVRWPRSSSPRPRSSRGATATPRCSSCVRSAILRCRTATTVTTASTARRSRTTARSRGRSAQKAESLQDKHKYGHADANAVLDAQGKLMPKGHFHGAFTGGFSAGYFNSVGSEEGWAPQRWKSSRGERSERQAQRAEDFMDAEDLADLQGGQKLVARAEYARAPAAAPAPAAAGGSGLELGERLTGLLRVSDTAENAGWAMLRRMGWREGFGVGAREWRGGKSGGAAGGAKKVHGARAGRRRRSGWLRRRRRRMSSRRPTRAARSSRRGRRRRSRSSQRATASASATTRAARPS